MEDAEPEQVEARSTIHLPFDQLETVILSLSLSVAPGQSDCCKHRIMISEETAGEARQCGILDRLNPQWSCCNIAGT